MVRLSEIHHLSKQYFDVTFIFYYKHRPYGFLKRRALYSLFSAVIADKYHLH